MVQYGEQHVKITGDEPLFPNNIVDLIHDRFTEMLPVSAVEKRPLRMTDLDQSVFVFAGDWEPDKESYEIGNHGYPSVERYRIYLQGLIRDADRDRGLRRHAVLAEMIRAMIYTDETLRIDLRSLESSLLGTNKKVQRVVVNRQRYYTTENAQRTFAYMSELEMSVEVEVKRFA